MNESKTYALMLVAGDRPGIVAEVSKVLYENNFNIEDSSSTLLKGFFAAIFVVSHDDGPAETEVKEMFAHSEKKLDIEISVQEIDEVPKADEGEHFIVSVYGSDKPGIVHAVTEYLSESNINVIDLQTKVAGGKKNPIYIMVLEVVIPADFQGDDWARDLKSKTDSLGIDINVRQIETYEL